MWQIKRFSNPPSSSRVALRGLAHFDFNNARAYGYEQAMLIMRQLKLPTSSIEQRFRRMAFNILARNQDDHVKNITFLMDREGKWSLALPLMSRLALILPGRGLRAIR